MDPTPHPTPAPFFTVAGLCRRELVSIPGRASVRAAAALMAEQHVGALAIVSDDSPPAVVGIVTDRDLALEVLGRGVAGPDSPVAPLARGPLAAVRGDAGVREAVATLQRAGVRRLLVTDRDGGVLGLVSADDLLEAIAQELGGLALALRSGVERERGQPQVPVTPAAPASVPAARRPVFPAFGTAAQR